MRNDSTDSHVIVTPSLLSFWRSLKRSRRITALFGLRKQWLAELDTVNHLRADSTAATSRRNNTVERQHQDFSTTKLRAKCDECKTAQPAMIDKILSTSQVFRY